MEFTPSSTFQTVSFVVESPSLVSAHYPDPETVKFLTEAEREALIADLPEQAPTMKADTWNFAQVKELFKDPTFVPFLMIWITHGIGGWGISFVLPTVIYELGISNTAISQVMTMPPFTLVFVILLTLAFFIHHGKLNSWVAGLGVEITQIVCYVLLITVTHPTAKYIFVMIATAASQSFFPIIWPGEFFHGWTGPGNADLVVNRAYPSRKGHNVCWLGHWNHQRKLTVSPGQCWPDTVQAIAYFNKCLY